MTQPTSTGPGPDDGTLIRYLDGELPPEEARAVEAALDEDGPVRRRYRRLARLSRRVGSALDGLETPPLPPLAARGQDRRGSRGGWRRAAAVLLVGAGILAAAVPSVRAGLMEGARTLAAWVAGPGRPEATPAVTRVTFPVEGSVFTVTFERVAEGRLVVGRTTGPDVVARSVSGEAALRVDPRGLRVAAGEGWTEVEVRLPDPIRELRLQLPGGEERTVSLAALDGPGSGTLRIPLAEER